MEVGLTPLLTHVLDEAHRPDPNLEGDFLRPESPHLFLNHLPVPLHIDHFLQLLVGHLYGLYVLQPVKAQVFDDLDVVQQLKEGEFVEIVKDLLPVLGQNALDVDGGGA